MTDLTIEKGKKMQVQQGTNIWVHIRIFSFAIFQEDWCSYTQAEKSNFVLTHNLKRIISIPSFEHACISLLVLYRTQECQMLIILTTKRSQQELTVHGTLPGCSALCRSTLPLKVGAKIHWYQWVSSNQFYHGLQRVSDQHF